MGRCGWGVGVALILAVLGASCGGTGGGPSDPGNQFVFTARGRLILSVQTVGAGVDQGCQSQTVSDPKRLLLTATLLDPQGVPFRNQRIAFTAEDFPDATFIPGNDNQGSVLTDDSGQASITLVAGLKLGKMRVIAEAPAALNISTGITVTLTQQGFVSQGPLGIIPTSVTFVNPAPHPPGGPADFTFQATGGDPPYKFSNSNPSVGKIETTGTCGSLGQYTLTGPLPTKDNADALKDTVTVQDEKGNRAQADVQVLFVTCSLNASPTTINIGGAVGGERADITITNGVPPFTATHTFPIAGNLLINQNAGIVTFVVATPSVGVNPDTILIRDSRNCTATVDVTIVPAQPQTVTTIVLTANPTTINGITGGTSTITALVLDENNKPIKGVSVLFVTDKGSVGPLTATTNASGQATTVLTIPAGTPAGVATVTGSARGVSGSVTVNIVTVVTGVAGPPAGIFVDLFANGSGNNNDTTCTTLLSALVVDAKGNPVDDGTRVDWKAPPPAIPNALVSIVSPSFTKQPPPLECDLSSYVRDTGIEFTLQPGDALTCLKYPRSLSGATVTINAAATGKGATASGDFSVLLPPCPFVPAGLAITPAAITLSPGQSQQFVVTGGLPPYKVTANGGTINLSTLVKSGDAFIYTAGQAPGDLFTIVVTDANGKITSATVKVEVPTLPVSPPKLDFCGTVGGETGRIKILAGVPPFTATHTFNGAGDLICEATSASGDTITCSGNSIIYEVQAAFPSVFDPDSVVIQDSQGKAVTVSVSINGKDCPSLCGNTIIDPGEQCDKLALGSATCATLGFSGGTLACSKDCTFDTSSCIPFCGNGTIDPGEQCDTSALAGKTCTDFGFTKGSLACSAKCTFDTSGCS